MRRFSPATSREDARADDPDQNTNVEVYSFAAHVSGTEVRLLHPESRGPQDESRRRLEFDRCVQGNDNTIRSVSFSPDGGLVATAGSAQDAARLWDVRTGEMKFSLKTPNHDAVRSVAFAPDGSSLALAHGDGAVTVWGMHTFDIRATLKGHTSKVHAVAYTSDSSSVLSGSGDTTARLWSAATGVCLRTLKGHKSDIYAVACSPCGNYHITGSRDQHFRVWDSITGSMLKSVHEHKNSIFGAAFTPDGKFLATTSADAKVKFWHVRKTWDLAFELNGHAKGVNGVGFTPNGGLVVTASQDTTLRLWNTVDGKAADQPIQTAVDVHHSNVRSVAVSRRGDRVVSVDDDGRIVFWSLQPPKLDGFDLAKDSIVYQVGSAAATTTATTPSCSEGPAGTATALVRRGNGNAADSGSCNTPATPTTAADNQRRQKMQALRNPLLGTFLCSLRPNVTAAGQTHTCRAHRLPHQFAAATAGGPAESTGNSSRKVGGGSAGTNLVAAMLNTGAIAVAVTGSTKVSLLSDFGSDATWTVHEIPTPGPVQSVYITTSTDGSSSNEQPTGTTMPASPTPAGAVDSSIDVAAASASGAALKQADANSNKVDNEDKAAASGALPAANDAGVPANKEETSVDGDAAATAIPDEKHRTSSPAIPPRRRRSITVPSLENTTESNQSAAAAAPAASKSMMVATPLVPPVAAHRGRPAAAADGPPQLVIECGGGCQIRMPCAYLEVQLARERRFAQQQRSRDELLAEIASMSEEAKEARRELDKYRRHVGELPPAIAAGVDGSNSSDGLHSHQSAATEVHIPATNGNGWLSAANSINGIAKPMNLPPVNRSPATGTEIEALWSALEQMQLEVDELKRAQAEGCSGVPRSPSGEALSVSQGFNACLVNH